MMKIIFTYIDSNEKAEEIAQVLLKEKLAACVGILHGKSRYWWKDKIEKNENEFHMIIKTTEKNVDEIMEKIKQLHTYELPVIDVLDTKVNKEAEDWLNEVTK